MKAKAESRITAEAVSKAINNGAKSITAVAKVLGYKSGSSGVIQAILKVVPDLRSRLQALNDLPTVVAVEADTDKANGKDKKTDKSETNKPASPTAYPIPDCVPYRKTSGYAMVWAILYANRKQGISKRSLVEKYMSWSGKPEENCKYDVQVVCSPKQDGTCNRSAAKASQSYWVERANDLLKMHLVDSRGDSK